MKRSARTRPNRYIYIRLVVQWVLFVPMACMLLNAKRCAIAGWRASCADLVSYCTFLCIQPSGHDEFLPNDEDFSGASHCSNCRQGARIGKRWLHLARLPAPLCAPAWGSTVDCVKHMGLHVCMSIQDMPFWDNDQVLFDIGPRCLNAAFCFRMFCKSHPIKHVQINVVNIAITWQWPYANRQAKITPQLLVQNRLVN